MALTFRSLNISTVGVLLSLLGSVAVLGSGLNVVREREVWVDHTNEVRSELELMLTGMIDAETGIRGFGLTLKDSFLEPYNWGRQAALDHYRRVKALTLDSPAQQLQIDQAKSDIDALSQHYRLLLDTARSGGVAAASAFVASGLGKEQMDNLRHVVQDMQKTEAKLLSERAAETSSSQGRLDVSLWATALVSLLVVLIAHYFIRRFLEQQLEEASRLMNETWHQQGIATMSDELRGDENTASMAQKALGFFASYFGSQVGSLYILAGDTLRIAAVYAREGQDGRAPAQLSLTGSIAGEAVRRGKLLTLNDVPESYVKIASSLGDTPPRTIVVVPIIFEEEVLGVVELGFLHPPAPRALTLLENLQNILGVTLSTAENKSRQQMLLEETQRQAEELQTQQEELRTSNEELENQAVALRDASDKQQQQQEELRQTNEELEQQARVLDMQKQTLAEQNDHLTQTQHDLETKAADLEMASRYKSDFLANMSHELRTPLNSLLLLATLLAENREGTLTTKQIDFAQTIFKSGNDLLALINDILDLSKVEAGKLELLSEPIDMIDLSDSLLRNFQHTASQKGLDFSVVRQKSAPAQVRTDRQRLEQILKNLLSNAIKFTASGSVGVSIDCGEQPGSVEFVVRDSGIGIPKDKLALIFEAFHQGDGSTSRSYGGTGLGLTISREISHLLGGTIRVNSVAGEGSVFTLTLPAEMPEQGLQPKIEAQIIPARVSHPVPAPRHEELRLPVESSVEPLKTGERRILIIEDDPIFGKVLVDLAAAAGFKAVLITTGEAALQFAKRNAVSAILLDMKLPDMSGLMVLEILKSSSGTRHVPIHVVSGADYAHNALSLGAIGYLQKPAKKPDLEAVFERFEGMLSKKVKSVLLVEDDEIQRMSIRELLLSSDVEIDEAISGSDAKERLKVKHYDCMVLDLRLPDVTGFELLKELEAMPSDKKPPVVVYTAKDLTREEHTRLEKYAKSIIIKGARSPERLLDEVSLFLHHLEASLPQKSQVLLQKVRSQTHGLSGRKILLVDDDMRNIFALVNALEASGVVSVIAKSGREALSQLDSDRDIELILMDIMMPEMDGYEAMQRIRKDGRFKNLPIIAVTAKAMKGDLEKCLAAGANDYLPKPVSLERLLSLLKVWLPQKV